jgi:hypothetical protein
VKGILRADGSICRANDEVKKEVSGFWGGIFGQVGEIKPESVEEICNKYPRRFLEVEKHEVDLRAVRKLLLRSNKMSCSPDGTHFLYMQRW